LPLLQLQVQQRAELRDEELKKIFAHGGIPFASEIRRPCPRCGDQVHTFGLTLAGAAASEVDRRPCPYIRRPSHPNRACRYRARTLGEGGWAVSGSGPPQPEHRVEGELHGMQIDECGKSFNALPSLRSDNYTRLYHLLWT